MANNGNKDLTTLININGEDFNVNAENAKTADKVANTLKFTKKLLTKKDEDETVTEIFSFDGSEKKEIQIVPAEGGRFKGRITVPDTSETVAKKDPKSVLNYNSVKNVVLNQLLNNALICTWDGTNINNTNSTNLKSFSIINGLDSQKDTFAYTNYKIYHDYLEDYEEYKSAYEEWSNTAEDKRGEEPVEPEKPLFLDAFIYISIGPTPAHTKDCSVDNCDCKKIGSMYVGTAESTTVHGVTVQADESKYSETTGQLKNQIQMDVNLAANQKVPFNGSEDVTLGVTGTLSVANGGTGATSIEGIRQQLSLHTVATTGSYNDLKDKPTHANGDENGIALNAKVADTAAKDGNGRTIASWYQKKIIVQQTVPTSTVGDEGDICIVY